MTSSENVINATARTEFGSASSRRLRNEGRIPAIVYGLGKENLNISIERKEWRLFARLDAQIIKLKIDKKRALNALVKDVQYDVLADRTLHIDLQEIDMNEEITAAVPVHPHGTAIGISQGGILTQEAHELEVSCLPDDLPESLVVEVTDLELEQSIHAADITLPENVKLVSDPEMLVLQVAPPRVQEEPEEVEAEEGAEEEAAEGEEEKAEAETEEEKAEE